MSTRDEWARMNPGDYTSKSSAYAGGYQAGRDALIAEGWRKMPSREELARWHDPNSFLPYDGEELATELWPDDAATRDRHRKMIEDDRLKRRVRAYEFADAILALMDRGQ